MTIPYGKWYLRGTLGTAEGGKPQQKWSGGIMEWKPCTPAMCEAWVTCSRFLVLAVLLTATSRSFNSSLLCSQFFPFWESHPFQFGGSGLERCLGAFPFLRWSDKAQSSPCGCSKASGREAESPGEAPCEGAALCLAQPCSPAHV